MMMRKIVAIILSLTALVGCFDAKIHNTEHPETSELCVAVDMPADGVYTIVVGGVEYEVVDGVASFPEYFKPGVYNAYVYNSTDNVTFSCTADQAVASVACSDGVVDSNPGVLYFGVQQLNVVADNVVSSKISMEQVTATIDFELTLSGGAFTNLIAIDTKLEGVAAKWDCGKGCCYESGYAEPQLTKAHMVSVARGSDVQSVVVEGSMTLLGVADGESQLLTITLRYDDGSSDVIPTDISSQLSSLNKNKTTPIKLSGEYETPLSGSVGTEIIDWIVVEDDDIVDIY